MTELCAWFWFPVFGFTVGALAAWLLMLGEMMGTKKHRHTCAGCGVNFDCECSGGKQFCPACEEKEKHKP